VIDRDVFFDAVRQKSFKGRLTQRQVDGLNAILDAWETAHAGKDLRWLAYALATTHHETGARMQPVHERGGKRYFFKMYDIGGRRPAKARELGNINPGDGARFHGRGYVQLTGRNNYAKMQRRFRTDLTSSDKAADRVLDPGLAAEIMFHGMENGVFTGKSFADYFTDKRSDWVRARAIINPGDKAKLVAGYARDYFDALKAASLKL
jgi:hypothetical protein